MAHPASPRTGDENDLWLRQHFLARLAALDRERDIHLRAWPELARHFAPRRGRFVASGGQRGANGDAGLLDNTPLLAARVMASGMMAGISSPARPWFRLRVADEAANRDPAVRAWLDDVQKRLLHAFARSNLYNCLHTLYGELGVFGTAALWVDEDDEDYMRGYTLTAGEFWLASSRRLAVDTLYRTMWWSARQIVEAFGREVVSAAVRASYDAGRLDQAHEIVHAVEPNPRAAAAIGGAADGGWQGRVASRLPFRSVWFERAAIGGAAAERALLRVGGYAEFPCMAPRWDVVGSDTWGSGPGAIALGDARHLERQQKRKLQAIDLQVNPPMIGPPSLHRDEVSFQPGGVTYLSEPAGQGLRPAYDVRLDLSQLGADIRETQARLERAFYADLFLMMADCDRRAITAREIDERHQEKMLMLGPVLERLHDELLDPLVCRVFAILARSGRIPPPPPALGGARLQVEFISLLAAAQKAAATGAIERVWQFGAQVGAVRPEALDRLDPDATMDAYADMLGVPSAVLVDRARAEAARRQRSAAAADRQALQDGLAVVEGAKTASQIDVGGGINAVQAMLGR